MKISRLFSTDDVKGTENYLASQKKYETARTILYFGISGAIFLIGFLQAKTRLNFFTLVAVLGCLPACKSLVGMIMFLRFQGCSAQNAREIKSCSEGLSGLYDMVFTAYDKNYNIAHMTVKGKTICAFTEDEKLDEPAFYKHLDGILKLDNFKDVTVKVFKDCPKYTERLKQLKELETDETSTDGIIKTLKSVVL